MKSYLAKPTSGVEDKMIQLTTAQVKELTAIAKAMSFTVITVQHNALVLKAAKGSETFHYNPYNSDRDAYTTAMAFGINTKTHYRDFVEVGIFFGSITGKTYSTKLNKEHTVEDRMVAMRQLIVKAAFSASKEGLV